MTTNNAVDKKDNCFYLDVDIHSRKCTIDTLEVATFIEKIKTGELKQTDVEEKLCALAHDAYNIGWKEGFGADYGN